MSAVGLPDPDSRRNIIAQQLEALGDDPHIVAAQDGNISATDKPSPDKLSIEPSTGDRARDDAGKFVAKDTKDIKSSKVKEPELPLDTSAAPSAPAPAVEPPLWERPPASWNKRQDLLDPWKVADTKLREMIWTREEQMNAGVLPLKEKAKLADAINEVAAPYMNTMRGLGVDLPKAVQGLMYADNILRTAPRDQAKAYLLQLAKTYNIQIGEGDGLNQAPQDPNYHALYNEITNIRGEVKSWQQQQAEAQQAQQAEEINRFALKAEFFEEARPTMIRLLQGGVATDIEDAYKKALRLDEDLSGKVAERTQAQTLATQSAAADKAAKAAKLAAVSVKTSTPGVSTTTKAQDRRAILEEAFSGIDARL